MQLLCPKCTNVMVQYERSGVTVDQCTECKGIFLDRGELERLAAAEAAWHAGPGATQDPPPRDRRDDRRYDDRGDDRRYDEDDDYDQRRGGRKRRRGSFLGDLFEFD